VRRQLEELELSLTNLFSLNDPKGKVTDNEFIEEKSVKISKIAEKIGKVIEEMDGLSPLTPSAEEFELRVTRMLLELPFTNQGRVSEGYYGKYKERNGIKGIIEFLVSEYLKKRSQIQEKMIGNA